MEEMPQIIAITGVKNKTKSEVKLSEFYIDGYVTVANGLEKSSRGIIAYVKSDKDFVEISASNDFEKSLWLKIKTRSTSAVTLGVVYKSVKKENYRMDKCIFKK
jgi:hypothetical protein